MNEKDLKSLIKDILHDMVGDDNAAEQGHYRPSDQTEKKEQSSASSGTDGMLDDISKVNIRTNLLVPNPHDKEGYLQMKEQTPARLGVWHTGARYMTSTALRFKADHAAAQDAVFSYVDEDFIKRNNLLSTGTIVQDKDEYVTRPDHGRRFSDEEKARIKEYAGNPTVQIVVGDGLSSASIEANLEDTLPAIKQGLEMYDIKAENDIFVKHCRVPAMDVIGEVTGADVVCLLVGERPGLVTAESMSAYIAYKPTVGMPEARRTVISNIHQGGTLPAEAGAHIAELIKRMLDNKASGLELSNM